MEYSSLTPTAYRVWGGGVDFVVSTTKNHHIFWRCPVSINFEPLYSWVINLPGKLIFSSNPTIILSYFSRWR